jgi:hypothetical protein
MLLPNKPGSKRGKMMAYQEIEEKRSGRIDVRELENWIEETKRILARMDKYQKAVDMPKNGDCADDKLASQASNIMA